MASVIAVALALTGCGDATPQPATSGVAAPSTEPATAPSPASPTYKILDKAALTKTLLPLNAMPTGYSEDDSAGSDRSDKTFCNYRQPHLEKNALIAALVAALPVRRAADRIRLRATKHEV